MMHEYYAKLFAYAPKILAEGIHQANQYDRFKIAIKFAFSVAY